MKKSVIVVYALLPILMIAQQVEKTSYPVIYQDQELRFPFAGGMDAPQFSNADLNRDGVQDVFVFDRHGYTAIPFVSVEENSTFTYAVDWSVVEHLPEVDQWALLHDFNNDGIEDLFASTQVPGVQGMDIYRGVDDNGKIRFEKMGFQVNGFEVVYFKFNQADSTPLYSAWIDIPAITDVDNDGDTDILSFEPNGSYVHYFRNEAVERGFGIDTFILTWEDECWGKFYENSFSEEIVLSNDPGDCASGTVAQPRHSGSAIVAYDFDGDLDKDMLTGDLASARVIMLTNGGTPAQAWMTDQELNFPSDDVPVDIPFFVSPFMVDINHDGMEDFVAASNNPSYSENYDVAWYYRNAGGAEFHLEVTDLFTSGMIDYGSESKPCFIDYNADGLDDLLIGTGGFYCPDCGTSGRDARLVLLENTGTADQPMFTVVDEDYLGFSAVGILQVTWEFAPAAGDIDQDGDIDLLIGERNGNLFFVENTAGADQPAVFTQPVYPYFDINVGTSSTPCIADLSGDGMPDIICGERSGNNDNQGRCSNLNYFENTGTPGNAVFIPDENTAPNTQCLGRVLFDGNTQYSAPVVITTNDGLRLITGSDAGELHVYSDIAGNVNEAFVLEYPDYGDLRDGERTTPAFSDIDADNYYEMVIGNKRGGLTVYQTDLMTMPVSVDDPAMAGGGVLISPNPTSGLIRLSLAERLHGSKISMRIYDPMGRLHADMSSYRVEEPFILHGPPGVYLVDVQIDEFHYYQRLLKQ